MNHPAVVLGTTGTTPSDVLAVARVGARVEISAAATEAMARSRTVIDDLARGAEPVYGVSTGFGALALRHIPAEDRARLQRSLVRSHAAGMGEPVEHEVVRAMQFLRLRTLCTGGTGVRPVVADSMAALLNAGLTPVVPEHGSLGCSGDLAPLAHCALVLMGEGEVIDATGARRPAAEALARHEIAPVQLREKEGLALINGTDRMLGMLLMALADLADLADLAAAMSVEALLGTDRVFAPELHGALRPHPGQAASAAHIHSLLAGSPLVASHREGDDRVQDAYSLRCAPQVHGAARDTLANAAAVAARELAACVDNPVVLPNGEVRSNCNFHGAPLGYVLDFLAIAACDMAAISERRTDRMLDADRSVGLPPFLADSPGVDSGLMIAQYTQAGIVAELRRLAVPASADTIPTSAMQEDHVSMGWGAARKVRRAVEGLRRVLAVELMAAARAIDLRAPLGSSRPIAAARTEIRRVVPGPGPDRVLADDMAAMERLLAAGPLLAVARTA